MKKLALRLTVAAAAAVLALSAAGCSSSGGDGSGSSSSQGEAPQAPATPLDLTGEWVQTNYDGDTIMHATIDTATIEVTYVNDKTSTTALFWAGSYVPPTEATDTYSWNSTNDTTKSQGSLLASPDPTKTFDYASGVLSFPMTAVGVTKTVELAQK